MAWEALVSGFLLVFTWQTLPFMVLGVAVGYGVGLLPGLGGPVAVALMLPYTLTMEPIPAFAFLLGMASVVATTGELTSILFGVPGEPTSAATVLDGHLMAKQGEAGRAIGASLMSSLVGALIGAIALAAMVPILRPLVLSFGAPEMFMIGLLGITLIGSLSTSNPFGGVIAGGLGLTISLVGLDPQAGVPRLTFGQLALWDGVGIVPVAVGIFAIPELVDLWVRRTSISRVQPGKVAGVSQGIRDTFVHWGITIRCSLIGTVVGVLPGLGGGVAQWVAYGHAVQSSRDKSRFGRGDVRGLLGPGSANNSKEGGSLVPTVAFGVPGSATMAVLLGAFVIQGLRPGPEMLTTQLHVTFSFVWIIVASNVLAVGVSLLLVRQLVKITHLPGELLVPAVLVVVLVGGYAARNSMGTVAITILFGLLGVVMDRIDWPRAPLVLGLVLGPILERNLFLSINRYGFDFLTRPLVLVGVLAMIGILVFSVIRSTRAKNKVALEGTRWR